MQEYRHTLIFLHDRIISTDLVEYFTVSLKKTQKLLSDFSVITICPAGLHDSKWPQSNGYFLVSMMRQSFYLKNYVLSIFTGDINLP
jgi:hypothetical protein